MGWCFFTQVKDHGKLPLASAGLGSFCVDWLRGALQPVILFLLRMEKGLHG